jgi:hypothetical protein
MVDEVSQLKEENAYKKEHRNLKMIVHKLLKDNKALQLQLFDILKDKKKLRNRKVYLIKKFHKTE